MKKAFCKLVIVVLVLAVSGCSDADEKDKGGDVFQPCFIDADSSDPAEAQCGGNIEPDVSCLVAGQEEECSTGACGRYEGSSPFCTKECEGPDDCPDGSCLEWVFGGESMYCVPM